MNIAFYLKNILQGLYASLRRFPVTIGLSAAMTFMLIYITHNESYFDKNTLDTLGRITMTIALGIPISLCIKLVFERTGFVKTAVKACIYLAGLASLLLYYIFLLGSLDMVPVTRYVAVSLALYLAFIFTPYFYRRENFELYVIKVFTRFFVTVIYSGVLFAGLAALLFAMDKLLSVPLTEKAYFYTWLLVAGIFAPSFFLAGLPTIERKFDVSDYPGLFKILLLYIVMPVIAAYTVILYIYFAKIIITRQWPIGLVAHLVLWYSVISTGVLFFTSPVSNENRWVKIFASWFIRLIIPLIAMMFVSLGMRIKAYGVTENRYYVAVLGLWVLGIMIYYNLVKSKRNIVLPVSLALVALLSVSGPWSSYSISKYSQNKRFESILLKYGMIENQSIIKSETTVSDADKTEISEILSYFNRHHQLDDVKYLPKGFKLEDMESLFGFPFQYGISYPFDKNKYFSYSVSKPGMPVDVSDYDYLFDLRNMPYTLDQPGSGIEVRYDNQSTEFSLLQDGREIYKTHLSDFGVEIHNKYKNGINKDITPEDMTFVEENEKVKLKLVFFNINGYEDGNMDKVIINYLDFYVLVREKQ